MDNRRKREGGWAAVPTVAAGADDTGVGAAGTDEGKLDRDVSAAGVKRVPAGFLCGCFWSPEVSSRRCSYALAKLIAV